jgi:hypothetical protein
VCPDHRRLEADAGEAPAGQANAPAGGLTGATAAAHCAAVASARPPVAPLGDLPMTSRILPHP